MSREIKFRAWNAYAKTMYDVDLLHIRNSKPMQPTHLEGNFMSLVYQPRVALMQYTGLKDKNGVEIYEGDIVKGWHYGQPADTPHVGIVESAPCIEGFDGFSIRTLKEAQGWGGFYDEEGPRWHELEVIGNIYENPELLEAAS